MGFFKVLKGGKSDEPEKVEKPDDQKPRAWVNMYDILTRLDLVEEYKLIQKKESRLPRKVRDAVVAIVEKAVENGELMPIETESAE